MGAGMSANFGVELIKAAVEGDLIEARKLLQAGANVNIIITTANNGPLTALYCATGVRPNIAIFLLLIRAGAPVNVKCGANLSTPLMQAAGHGNTDMMKVLMQRGALVNVGDKDNDTALHYAAMNMDTPATALLLQNNANPNARNNKNRTPLHIACVKGDLEVILLLKAAGANSHIKDSMGAKPADLALLTGNGAAIVMLLAAE